MQSKGVMDKKDNKKGFIPLHNTAVCLFAVELWLCDYGGRIYIGSPCYVCGVCFLHPSVIPLVQIHKQVPPMQCFKQKSTRNDPFLKHVN